MTNLRSLLAEALEWMNAHEPELPNKQTSDLMERIEAALAQDEPSAPTRAVCIGGREADAGAIMLLQVPPDFGFRVGDAYEVSPVNRTAE